mgnify:FL=1
MGITNAILVDGNEKRLDLGKKIGAAATLNFMDYPSSEALVEKVKELTGGVGAGFVFQTTGNAKGFQKQ